MSDGSRSGGVRSRPEWLAQFERQEIKARRRTRLRKYVDRLLLLVVLVAVWELVVKAGLVRPFFISSPSLIAEDLRELAVTGDFYFDIYVTLRNALLGLVIGVVTGTAAALVFALIPRLASAAQPALVAFNSLPRVALAPLFVVWLGFGAGPKVLLAAFTVFFLVFYNVLSGVTAVDRSLVWNFQILRLSKFSVVRRLYIPSATIWVIAALKNAISLAVTAAVVAEFVGATAGLGYEMTQAISFLNTTRMFSILVVLMVIGLVLFEGVGLLEKRTEKWR